MAQVRRLLCVVTVFLLLSSIPSQVFATSCHQCGKEAQGGCICARHCSNASSGTHASPCKQCCWRQYNNTLGQLSWWQKFTGSGNEQAMTSYNSCRTNTCDRQLWV